MSDDSSWKGLPSLTSLVYITEYLEYTKSSVES